MTSPAARAHDALTALLALAIVPDPAGRHRRTADFADYVPHQQRADAVMRRLAPALSMASAGSGLLAAATQARREPAAAAWRAASAAAVAAAVALTVRVHVPFNRQLRTWTPGREVPGWREGRARWERAHRVRRALVVAAGAAVLAARG
ncbi:anthrone oxygenase family protein [Kineococcus auxinigenes]|uniref:anthrone oxygenase family protein n=1 Tax=unclassified Kineococcus TaxID=2621656 RepID=UPI003D7F1439